MILKLQPGELDCHVAAPASLPWLVADLVMEKEVEVADYADDDDYDDDGDDDDDDDDDSPHPSSTLAVKGSTLHQTLAVSNTPP